jgi:hypothetical protein
MKQPQFDQDDPEALASGKDTEGNQWLLVLADSKGKVLAGRDLMGNFHSWASNEQLFDSAMSTMLDLQGIELPTPPERSTS